MERSGMRLWRAGVVVTALGVAAWLDACSDSPGPCFDCLPPPTTGLIVSNRVPQTSASASAGVAAAPTSPNAGEDFVYVSLTPGTVPAGAVAIIERLGDVGSTITTLLDGGFEPVPVGAQPGDSIDVLVRDAAGTRRFQSRKAVAASRPPVVVRSDPPRGKTDVAINAAIVVVFSEPVAGASTTPSSIRLLTGSNAVSGAVRFLDPSLDGSHVSVQFVPDTPLAPHTQYQLVVTQQVRDLSGDPLAAPDTVAFTTGASSTGPPASIHTSPDSQLFLRAGDTYQLTAIVRDSTGNVLTDRPVTWSDGSGLQCNGYPGVLTVSATGLVTALADGLGSVVASVGGVGRCVFIFIAPNPAASITIAPNPATVAATDTIILAATVRDAAGRVITNRYVSVSVEWTSSAPAVATVTPYCVPLSGCVFGEGTVTGEGTITGVSPGNVTITATSGTVRTTATVTVGPARPVASVIVAPDPATLVVSGFAKLFATLRDANNQAVSRRKVTWMSDNAAVATVDTSGLVRGVSLGSARVSATAEGVSDTAAITVMTISVASLDAGGAYTCGLTASGAAYCWGLNWWGLLGFGAGTGQGPEENCGFVGGNPTNCSTVPVAVIGGLTFASLSASSDHTCGLTTGGAAYCWGNNQLDLGQGNSADDSVPAAVSGGLTFSSVSAGGGGRTCALTASGAAYCWGNGPPSSGSIYESRVPLAVSGGLTFASLSAGQAHTCGLTTSGAAYCWGYNGFGQLGDGSTTDSPHVPVAVTGGLTFASLSGGAGGFHTCGLTTSGAAYCWGFNSYGQIGDGSTNWSHVPVAVSGGLTFASLSAGGSLTCGVTTSGAAYCWGSNFYGELGDGSTSDSDAPVAVTGGLTFASLRAGGSHACGVTTSGAAYCWGFNESGALGNGTVTNSNVPVKVAGQP